jgi:hypothetical protein
MLYKRLLDEGSGDLRERRVMLKKKIWDEVKDISLEILLLIKKKFRYIILVQFMWGTNMNFVYL